jgi:hypothetical protein
MYEADGRKNLYDKHVLGQYAHAHQNDARGEQCDEERQRFASYLCGQQEIARRTSDQLQFVREVEAAGLSKKRGGFESQSTDKLQESSDDFQAHRERVEVDSEIVSYSAAKALGTIIDCLLCLIN